MDTAPRVAAPGIAGGFLGLRGAGQRSGRSRRPGRVEARRNENDGPSRPVCTLTLGEERSPPQRGAPGRAPGGLRSRPEQGARRGAGRGGRGKRGGARAALERRFYR